MTARDGTKNRRCFNLLDLRIAEISQNAGESNDGIVRGKVNQSLLTTSLSNVKIAGNVYAIRKDASGTGQNFVDVSTAAGNDTTDDFEPFGPTATFSADDVLYVACDHDIKEMFFQISTPGVWTGTGISVFDSTDGKTANRQLSNVVDGTNGFRNTAWYWRVSWDEPSTNRVAFSPVPGDIAERKWIVIKLNGFVSGITAPKLTRMWLVHPDSEEKYMDVTAINNASMTDNSFGSFDTTVFPVVGTTHYYAFPYLSYGMEVAVFRKFSVSLTRSIEYLAADNTWKTLPDWNDPSNGLTNGPATLGTTATTYSRRWTIPSDWAQKTLSFAMSDDTTKAVTGYFIRMPITALSQYGPISRALWRARVRAFGVDNSSGFVKFKTATTISRVNIGQIGVPSTTEMKLQLVNINTGQGRTVTVPANTSAPYITDLATTLSFSVNDQMAIMYVSGTGTISDLEIHIE